MEKPESMEKRVSVSFSSSTIEKINNLALCDSMSERVRKITEFVLDEIYRAKSSTAEIFTGDEFVVIKKCLRHIETVYRDNFITHNKSLSHHVNRWLTVGNGKSLYWDNDKINTICTKIEGLNSFEILYILDTVKKFKTVRSSI